MRAMWGEEGGVRGTGEKKGAEIYEREGRGRGRGADVRGKDGRKRGGMKEGA